KGEPVRQRCVDKVMAKFTHPSDSTGCIEKVEAKGGCATIGEAAGLESKVDAFVLDVVNELDPGYPTPVLNKCSAGKKKCVASKVKAMLGCYGKAAGKGLPLDPLCIQKAKDKFDGGIDPTKGCFAKLEAK